MTPKPSALRASRTRGRTVSYGSVKMRADRRTRRLHGHRPPASVGCQVAYTRMGYSRTLAATASLLTGKMPTALGRDSTQAAVERARGLSSRRAAFPVSLRSSWSPRREGGGRSRRPTRERCRCREKRRDQARVCARAAPFAAARPGRERRRDGAPVRRHRQLVQRGRARPHAPAQRSSTRSRPACAPAAACPSSSASWASATASP